MPTEPLFCEVDRVISWRAPCFNRKLGLLFPLKNPSSLTSPVAMTVMNTLMSIKAPWGTWEPGMSAVFTVVVGVRKLADAQGCQYQSSSPIGRPNNLGILLHLIPDAVECLIDTHPNRWKGNTVFLLWKAVFLPWKCTVHNPRPLPWYDVQWLYVPLYILSPTQTVYAWTRNRCLLDTLWHFSQSSFLHRLTTTLSHKFALSTSL